MKLSIIIPCYNEDKTLETIFDKVNLFNSLEKEIIIVDDFSSDRTSIIIEDLKKKHPNLKDIRHEKNLGKGGALKSGLSLCTGDLIIIQDADLEYDPSDYTKLVEPFLNADADVVYGTRFKGGSYTRLHFFWHYVANQLLTLLTNIFTNLNMSDMETGYKVFKSSAIKSITLKENSFGIEPEITMKLAKKNFIFYEVSISYKGRSYSEGKKITLKDAFIAVFCIIRYRFFD